LIDALKGIEGRNITNRVDSIYSIIGTLPYISGEWISIDYKPRECSACPSGKEEEYCRHGEENKK